MYINRIYTFVSSIRFYESMVGTRTTLVVYRTLSDPPECRVNVVDKAARVIIEETRSMLAVWMLMMMSGDYSRHVLPVSSPIDSFSPCYIYVYIELQQQTISVRSITINQLTRQPSIAISIHVSCNPPLCMYIQFYI